MINSLSVEDLFWCEMQEGRISFRHKDLPDSIHFTFSWTNPKNMNFHITKNIGDGNNKPQIKIATWTQELIDSFSPYIPALVIGKMYEPISFKRYSRKSRHNIRIIFFDEIENDSMFKTLEKAVTTIFKKHSSIKKKKRLKINTTIEEHMIPFFSSAPIKSLFLNSLRALKCNSFVSPPSRCGIIFMGNKKEHFVTHNNSCFILKKRGSVQDFLKIFMNPELVNGLLIKINEALVQIQQAETFADTIPHNKPYQLFLEA